MDHGSSEERITSARSSPKPMNKSSTIFGGLWPKRSTKVEPHPMQQGVGGVDSGSSSGGYYLTTPCGAADGVGDQLLHDMSFAKCSPEKRYHQVTSSKPHSEQINNNSVTSPNPSHIPKQQQIQACYAKTNINAKAKNNHSEKNSAIITVNRRIKNPRTLRNNKTDASRHTTDGSQSDGADIAKAALRKHRSPNHNRFSHQFSLCCKVDRKPMTPPVSVRYNSIPDSQRRENLSLNLSLADEADANSINSSTIPQPPASVAATSTTFIECSSAPETPMNGKCTFMGNNSHSSPSNSSVKSTQSDSSGQPRSIAITACRSRLRLKLLPPGKDTPIIKNEQQGQLENQHHHHEQQQQESPINPITPQHNSSPNISSQPAIIVEHPDGALRSMSQENIQLQRTQSQLQSQAPTGLARQALMAAQVLSLIPTEKARERSYLDGRLGSSSLLGPSELIRVLPHKEVTIFVGTWNMNGQSPPKEMNDFVLPAAIEHVPDIVAIGTQESSPDRFEWEVSLQETLGPSHVLFHSTTLGTLHLAVYMRRDLIWFCSTPEDANMSVRPGTAFRTKGAIAISFCLFGTSMLFVTSHLTAHQQKVKERVQDVKRIIHALDLPKNLNLRHKNKDVTQNFDNVFWCGDLNFRLSEPREKLLDWIQNTKFPLPSHLPHGYMHTDQLTSVLADGAAFRGFMEANITFPPTYKYDPGTQQFDTSSKQRAPAYTDRILFKYRQNQGLSIRRASTISGLPPQAPAYVQCISYDSVPSIISSDHKPVWALFKTSIRAGADSIPLAAGLFCRDIYMEGMKRRLNNQYTGSSAVCAIQ